MKKSTEMPEPQTLDYNTYYRVTPLFINDLKIVMNNGNVAYVDAKRLFDKIKEYNGLFPSAILNEFIRDIGKFPYKVVSNIMEVIEKQENFHRYFELVKPQQNNQSNTKK